jgi:hypoxanthine phosphoribosyltransferase
MAELKELLSEAAVAEKVDRLAAQIAPRVTDETVAVCLLTGGLWFAADLTRALFRYGRNLRFDALWIASYGDEHVTSGRVLLRAGLQRPVVDRQVLVIDDVMDSGLSLREASRLLSDAGAKEVLTAVFARKPWPTPRPATCDFAGWEAPASFILGYGMDAGGAYRGMPGIFEMVEPSGS